MPAFRKPSKLPWRPDPVKQRNPWLGRRRNAKSAFAVKYDLVADAALAMQPHAAVLLGQFHHLHTDVDDVANFNRPEKAQGLGNIDRARPGNRMPMTPEMRLAVYNP
jgi:hypothetical protein